MADDSSDSSSCHLPATCLPPSTQRSVFEKLPRCPRPRVLQGSRIDIGTLLIHVANPPGIDLSRLQGLSVHSHQLDVFHTCVSDSIPAHAVLIARQDSGSSSSVVTHGMLHAIRSALRSGTSLYPMWKAFVRILHRRDPSVGSTNCFWHFRSPGF